VRVFVALDVPDDVRRALREFLSKLTNTCPGARWANVE
jgi:2'-5' RNA ligase